MDKQPLIGATAYIYMMTDGRHHKFGVSQDPEKRLRQLATGNPKIRLVETWLALQPLVAERAVHTYFERRGRSVKGSSEWFYLREQEVDMLESMDDPMFNSWILHDCPEMGSSPEMIYNLLKVDDDGNRTPIWRLWFLPMDGVLLEMGFCSLEKPPRSVMEDYWKNHPKEMLSTCVIRTIIKVGEHELAVLARAVGHWRDRQYTDLLFREARELHKEPADVPSGIDKKVLPVVAVRP